MAPLVSWNHKVKRRGEGGTQAFDNIDNTMFWINYKGFESECELEKTHVNFSLCYRSVKLSYVRVFEVPDIETIQQKRWNALKDVLPGIVDKEIEENHD
jgi:hypothetical protein